jgi:hypothetical protein
LAGNVVHDLAADYCQLDGRTVGLPALSEAKGLDGLNNEISGFSDFE